MVRQLLNTNCNNIVGYDNSEIDLFNLKNELNTFSRVKLFLGDILDDKLLEYVVKKEKINIIFHAAAYKHVTILQKNVQSAVRNNIFGTYKVLNVAKNYNIPIVTISTDKAVRPTSILGLTREFQKLCVYNITTNSFPQKL